MIRSPLMALALTAPILVSGCAAAVIGTAGAVGVASVQERSLGEAVDDSTVSNQIKAMLLNESGFGEVDVEVVQGLVLLSGRVATPEHRVRAEDIAWTATRTRDVANEIVIEQPGGFFANASDELITARVRASLIAAKNVKSINYNIETYNGVVYLMGIAQTNAELKEAAERASVVGGVDRVVSYVKVRPTPAQFNASSSNSDSELLGGSGS
ncbi:MULTISPECIES: BON domain-containing protein [Henriciella]|jgi:osmotically-inducible protein OsmY|uniref:Phospholipid-binding protein n=1 Tax=Henriciella pelagia TaxID=1977912 RepID=A0ABQ1JL52_9PROT|nr:BON domain-containing protein [Henriciella pelagia]GGB68653.1 phospholipid-binding protein [Henriciella pelagia]